jgi:hypothetical protein
MFEDVKRVTRSPKSKKDRQCNDQMKNDKRINDFEQHELTMNPDVNSCTSEGNEVLAPLMAPVKVVTRLSCSFLVSVLKQIVELVLILNMHEKLRSPESVNYKGATPFLPFFPNRQLLNHITTQSEIK